MLFCQYIDKYAIFLTNIRVFRLLFLLFVTVPLVELYLLIHVGSYFGAAPTIALCLFTAAFGAILLRHEGLETMSRVQSRLEQGEMPAEEMIGGLMLLLSGLLLLTPGLLTDIIGFVCLLPGFRLQVARAMLAPVLRRHAQRFEQGQVIVEGEFWEEQDRKRLGE